MGSNNYTPLYGVQKNENKHVDFYTDIQHIRSDIEKNAGKGVVDIEGRKLTESSWNLSKSQRAQSELFSIYFPG